MPNIYNLTEKLELEEPTFETIPIDRVYVFPVERFLRLETAVDDLKNLKWHFWAGVLTVSAITLSVVAIVYQSMQTTMEVAKAANQATQSAPPPIIINVPSERKR